MSIVTELMHLLRAGYPVIAIDTAEESHALEIVKQAVSAEPGEVWQWTAATGLTRAETLSSDNRPPEPLPETENPAAALATVTRREGRQILIALDLMSHADDSVTVRAARDLVARFERAAPGPVSGGHLITIDHQRPLPGPLAAVATTLEIPLPDDAELESILRQAISRYHRDVHPIDVDLTKADFRTVLTNLRGLTRDQAKRIALETVARDNRIDAEDLTTIIDAKRRLFSSAGTLEFVDRPADLSQIGGLRNLKRWLRDRERAFGEEAKSFGLTPPRGVLMLGVQGTGKSLCARAIATAWNRPLLRLDAGSLYNSYIGASERNLRQALKQAEASAPVVLWIDEIEKAFSSAASTSSDGGLSRRMFGALLTWMQEHTAPVFLVATANDIDALPPELLRKGRFDEIFFVDLPTADVRKEILGIHLRKRDMDPAAFDLDRLSAVSEGFSAAELEHAVVSALHSAYAEKLDGRGSGSVTTEMVERVIAGSPPLSVTAAEKVRALQAWAADRCVPAD